MAGRSRSRSRNGKSLTATVVMAGVTMAATYGFILWHQCRSGVVAVVVVEGMTISQCLAHQQQTHGSAIAFWSFLASVTGSLVELFDVFQLDDNFRIPMLTGGVIWMVRQMLSSLL